MYVVWFNMLFGDSRDRWDGDGLSDPRVRHFWDEQKVVGNWYSANVTESKGTTWDFYALYDPAATWTSSPPKAVDQDGTIIGHHDELKAAITPLLRPTG
ncbi:MAG: hypothetical protein JO020_00215 [Chloroflexi bacterium]|nr:hypothetical protein [Chloroflexota bacterium]MBV9134461.1 hypothetical protein [Chloroflexota bacterium]MBV9892574.1 hypothetical protein [Chloroflexota bacterium]